MDKGGSMVRTDGGWLFISHSHEDIAEVRKIRNYLEDEGFNPIVFFLKSKTNKWTLNRLIKKEIKARKWFVLVDTPASRKSKWVQQEIKYVDKLKGKIKLTVDPGKELIPQLKGIIRRTRVFMSYSHKDQEISQRIAAKLSNNDFQVWRAIDNLRSGSSFTTAISDAIDDTSRDGFFMILLTESSVNSPWCERELSYAYKKNCMIIPVVVLGTKLPPVFEYFLGHLQHLYIHQKPDDAELDRLIDQIIQITRE